MLGPIVEEPGTAGFHSFDDVGVYLYTENRDLIDSQAIGTLNESVSVSISSQEIPHYVIIDSPDFWRVRGVQVTYYQLADEKVYSSRVVASRGELPVTPAR